MKVATNVKGFLIMMISTAVLSLPQFAVGQVETIDAIARGASTQMGKDFNVKITINQFSTPQDIEALEKAFQNGGHDALVKALSKMKGVGRVRLPSTTGYSIAYAQMPPTPSGRKLRFVTDRLVTFPENRNVTRSKGYDLTAAEIEINDQDKSKSTGVLYPSVKISLNKEGAVQFDLLQSSRKLVNITDWKPKEKQ